MFSSSAPFTRAEQDRQRVQNRHEKMQSDYAKGMTAFDKDLKGRLAAAADRKQAAIKQKVPLAHKCPASGECEECEERLRKSEAARKALMKPKGAFKKKTLNRQLSRSADDVNVVWTETKFAKETSLQYARGGGKDISVQKSSQTVKVTVNNTSDNENWLQSIAGWMGLKGKPAEPSAPAVSPAGTAKDAICSTPVSNYTGIVPAAPIHPRDGYVKDTAAMFLQISDAHSSSVTPKGSPSMAEVIMPRTVTMAQSMDMRNTARSVVTKKGTTKDVVTAKQTNQQTYRFSMK